MRPLAAFQWKLRHSICSCFVTIHPSYRQQTDRWQTTYHDNSRTSQWNCNVRLKKSAFDKRDITEPGQRSAIDRETVSKDGQQALGHDQYGRNAFKGMATVEAIGGVLMLVLYVRELTDLLTTRTAAFITRCRGWMLDCGRRANSELKWKWCKT